MILAFFFAPLAIASEIAMQQIPNAKKVGEGRLSVVFWDVYDATLYAPNGQWHPEKPYALSIRYFREIEGGDIADRSIAEIKKQGFSDQEMLEDWHKQMLDILPNVKNGTELTALFTDKETTDFYHSGKRIGTINDPLFGKHFFGIWLNENTSEPTLRRALLGQS
ncbi:MAG: chalcone isomerase family protein [Alphaproteobacteria bacterium]|nr:chalcone isomerase family protein [Alphaproteobacteria bacterium]